MDDLRVPDDSAKDVDHALGKALVPTATKLLLTPVVGGVIADALGASLAEFFNLVVQPPLEKRRIAWMHAVVSRLEEIDKRLVNLEKLQSDERFISVFMQATSAAMRTHESLKLEALRNAVVNVAIGQEADEAMESLLIQTLESLSELQLRILTILDNPLRATGMKSYRDLALKAGQEFSWVNPPETVARATGEVECSGTNIINYVIPSLADDQERFHTLIVDLENKGLLHRGELVTSRLRIRLGNQDEPEYQYLLPFLGKRLLVFIRDSSIMEG